MSNTDDELRSISLNSSDGTVSKEADGHAHVPHTNPRRKSKSRLSRKRRIAKAKAEAKAGKIDVRLDVSQDSQQSSGGTRNRKKNRKITKKGETVANMYKFPTI